VLALVFLGEAVSIGVGAGIGVLVCGLVLLSLSRGGDRGGWRRTELLFPLGAAAGFATADVIRRFGLTTTGATALHGVTINETAGVLALAAYVLARRPDTFRSVSARTYVIFGLSGAANAVSFLLFFVALDIGPVAIATSFIGTTPLFTLVFTYLFLGDLERITKGVIAGAGLVVLGTVVIAIG
jgi:drug/metabolite transporter (DMT)-like permease